MLTLTYTYTRMQAISDPWGNDPEDFAVPRFLHATAKLTRHLIDDVVDDPLETKSSVQIGSPELGHVPLDGQVRARARACAWAREYT